MVLLAAVVLAVVGLQADLAESTLRREGLIPDIEQRDSDDQPEDVDGAPTDPTKGPGHQTHQTPEQIVGVDQKRERCVQSRPIGKVEVGGQFQRVAPLQIEEMVAPFRGSGFLSIDLDTLRAALETIPWVDRARVERRRRQAHEPQAAIDVLHQVCRQPADGVHPGRRPRRRGPVFEIVFVGGHVFLLFTLYF